MVLRHKYRDFLDRLHGGSADAFNNALDPSNQVAGRSVYVVRVGTVYYVEDATAGAGEFAMGMTMDANYAVIARVAG